MSFNEILSALSLSCPQTHVPPTCSFSKLKNTRSFKKNCPRIPVIGSLPAPQTLTPINTTKSSYISAQSTCWFPVFISFLFNWVFMSWTLLFLLKMCQWVISANLSVSWEHASSPDVYFTQTAFSFVTFTTPRKTWAHASIEHPTNPAITSPPSRDINRNLKYKVRFPASPASRGCWISRACHLSCQTPLRTIIKKGISLYRFLSRCLKWG